VANFSVPIKPVETTSGNQWLQNRLYEDASQTFYADTPVEIYTTGGVKVWDGTTLTNGIVGIAYEAASNLATLGGATTPYVQPLQPYSGPGATLTFGKVPNESSASNIPHGAPLNDGRCGFTLANADTIFSGAFGTSAAGTGSSVASATPAITNIGIGYGLTLDTNGYWFVDVHKTTSSAAVTVVGLDPRDTPAAGTRVLFKFLNTVCQFQA
jgi:hypothetical protein